MADVIKEAKKLAEKVVEKVGIELSIYPDWTGKRDYRVVGIDKGFKFTVGVPVPITDAEASGLYGEEVTLAFLIQKGARQLSYDRDTNIGNLIKEDLEKGVDFGRIEDVAKYSKELQDEMSTKKVKRPAAKAEDKRIADQAKEAGMKDASEETWAEVKAFMLAKEAEKAKAVKKNK